MGSGSGPWDDAYPRAGGLVRPPPGTRLLRRDEHLVDDVDHAIGGAHVRLDDTGAADAHLAVAHPDRDAVTVERLDRVHLDDPLRRVAAGRDVVEQDLSERGAVLEQGLERLRRNLLERRVRRREDGERALTRKRLRQSGALDQLHERVEVTGRNG